MKNLSKKSNFCWKLTIPAIFILFVGIAYTLWFHDSSVENTIQSQQNIAERHVEGLSPVMDSKNRVAPSPFALCSDNSNCSVHSEYLSDDRLPIHIEIQHKLEAIRNGDLYAAQEAYSILTECNKIHRSRQLLSSISGRKFRNQELCNRDETLNLIGKVDYVFSQNVSRLSSDADVLIQRIRWLVAKASLEDATISQQDLEIHRANDSMTVKFTDLTPEKKSPIWKNALTLAESNRLQSDQVRLLADDLSLMINGSRFQEAPAPPQGTENES